MQDAVRSLLAAGLVSLAASCVLNDHGLSVGGDAGANGATGAAGAMTGAAGTAGMTPPASGTAGTATGASGSAGGAAATGADAAAGMGGDNGGAAGADTSGAGNPGAAAAGGDGGAGGGQAGDMETAGTSGGGGAAGTANVTMPDPGCADGTREGFVDIGVYPSIAACAGGWDEPGLLSIASQTPECDRNAGNEGNNPEGHGCSVADLCAAGWHVCETAHDVALATGNVGCPPAYELYLAKPAFFVTRQRAQGLVCDPTNEMGTNNLYGCGNIGSAADKSCAPFMHMLRDSDCANHSPWACADGQVGNSQDEYSVVTKAGAAAGGVLCCKD
jgi:hypothetical protein